MRELTQIELKEVAGGVQPNQVGIGVEAADSAAEGRVGDALAVARGASDGLIAEQSNGNQPGGSPLRGRITAGQL
jgi:hypothetical protein